MSTRRSKWGGRLSYANVTATLALVFAMSGGALAASRYLINSTRQINPKVLKALRANAAKAGSAGATGPAGAAGTEGPPGAAGAQGNEGPPGRVGKEGTAGPTGKEGLDGKEGLPGNEGLPGKEGKEGPPGREGKEGPPPKLGAIVAVAGTDVKVEPGTTGESVAECPQGTRAISGGYGLEGETPTTRGPNLVSSTAQAERKGWIVKIANPGATESNFVEAVAYCAKEGEAVGG